MAADSTKIGVREFGDLLIKTQDLDPTYVGLHGAGLEVAQLSRWLLAYWCFYHVGLASWLSEHTNKDYWRWMGEAAANIARPPNARYERWPRAPERRHFRGQKCVDAVDWLSKKEPEHWVGMFLDAPNRVRNAGAWTDKQVMKKVQDWPLFGPWIAFKVADMLERCAGVPVKFDPNIALMYDEPRAGLGLCQLHSPPEYAHLSQTDWYNALSLYFRARLAPPARDRTCGPQEVETVLCKWKSYMGGHYHLGKDITDHRNALDGWGITADRIKKAMPEEVK
jgi:hypothetical protein